MKALDADSSDIYTVIAMTLPFVLHSQVIQLHPVKFTITFENCGKLWT